MSNQPALPLRMAAIAAAAGLCACEGPIPARKSVADAGKSSPAKQPAPAPISKAVATRSTPPPASAPSTGGITANRPADISSRPPVPQAATSPSPTKGGAAGQPSSSAFNVYGDAMGRSMASKGTARSGGNNISQVSFSQEGGDFDPDVSRDGKQVVFASTQHRPLPDIYIKSVESRVVTQLTNDPASDVMPRISPDGTRVAFASNRTGNWDIFVMPISGGRAIQITSSAADDLHPSWSPDGSQLVFCRMGEVSGQWEMWVTDVGNTGVAKFIGYGLFPEWCPMGGTGLAGADRIAYQKSRERGERTFGIWTVDYKDGQAGNTTEIVSSPIAACINPAWSRDGAWVAFATVPNPSQWSNEARPSSADLWMVDINGNTRIALTGGSAVNFMPAWGPDNRLFFVSDRSGTDNIWAMDTSGVIQLAAANMRGSALAHGASPGRSIPKTQEHSATEAPPAEPPVATVPSESPGNDPH